MSSRRRPEPNTRQPRASAACAIARPIPLVAPVTTRVGARSGLGLGMGVSTRHLHGCILMPSIWATRWFRHPSAEEPLR